MTSNRKLTQLFVGLFLLLLAVPLLTTNRQDGVISQAENRVLAQKPRLHLDDGTLNRNFTRDFENWFNDNVGLRSQMVTANARIQFHGFQRLADNSDLYLGPNGELNYATSEMLLDYQHVNLYTDEELGEIAAAYQAVSDFLSAQGIPFYYFQCWDKHSIYPEHFPDTVIQFGNTSKTDQIVAMLKDKTNIHLVSPKQELINSKACFEPYSVWGDATHWTQRGAFIAYTALMSAIDEQNPGKYKILTEQDYDIEIVDIGSTLFGGIHQENLSEQFTIRDPQAYLSEEAPFFVSSWATTSRNVYYNENAGNRDTLLIFGDSYIDSFLYDDLAESFYKVVMVRDYLEYLPDVVAHYQPTIVLVENAERCDRSASILRAAEFLSFGREA